MKSKYILNRFFYIDFIDLDLYGSEADNDIVSDSRETLLRKSEWLQIAERVVRAELIQFSSEIVDVSIYSTLTHTKTMGIENQLFNSKYQDKFHVLGFQCYNNIKPFVILLFSKDLLSPVIVII